MPNYKAVLSNKLFYEELLFGDNPNAKIIVGTEIDCDVRLHKEWFQDKFWLEFIGYEGKWSVRCSDNLYIYTGDVRR